MATLAGVAISTEILVLIASYTSRADLVSLCRVCHAFQKVSESLLYEHIDYTWNGFSSQLKPIPLLWRTLIRRPDLASYIRNLHLRGWAPLTLRADVTWERNGDRDLTEQFDSKSLVRQLLTVLPKLRSLELNPCFEDESAFTLDCPATNLASASSLEHVKIHCFPKHLLKACFPDPVDFTGLLDLPALKSLDMKIVEPPSGLPPSSHDKRSEKLNRLALHQSHLTEESLAQILSRTPNLSTFEYHYSCDVDASGTLPRQFNGPKITQALDQVKRTLRSLTISVGVHTDQAIDIGTLDPTEFGVAGTLGPLTEFNQLEELTVPLVVLLGWTPDPSVRLSDILPPNLRVLCCTDDLGQWDMFAWRGDTALSSFREYLAKEGTGGGLRVLKLHAEGYDRLWTPNLLQELRALCEPRNIWCGFDLRSDPEDLFT